VRITLPTIKWGIAYGVVLSIARCIGEFGAVKIVSGNLLNRTKTATLVVEQKYQDFDQPGAYAMSFVLVVVAVACILTVARALAVEPKLLLLDEPFGALDAKVRKQLRDWLRRLHDEVHVTTLFVTHDQDEALEVSDELVIINNGAIEQSGSPNDLYDRPANEFVMGFLGPVTTLAGKMVRPHDLELFDLAEPGTVPVTVERITRIGFEVRVDLRTGEESTWVQTTRGQADGLDLVPGRELWLRASPHASTITVAG